ncbi:hypothetical protein EDC01DRAFT_668379 [Geopyxis carbonaria]|nr:hypothetical protein EDC01DRAFT_668379 [Geopyxis carbonaria]
MWGIPSLPGFLGLTWYGVSGSVLNNEYDKNYLKKQLSIEAKVRFSGPSEEPSLDPTPSIHFRLSPTRWLAADWLHFSSGTVYES